MALSPGPYEDSLGATAVLRLKDGMFNFLSFLPVLIAGLSWGFSFPAYGHASLAWITPALILIASNYPHSQAALRKSYFIGILNYLVSLHWLLHMPFLFGAISGWLALSAYMAVYPMLWVWFCRLLMPAQTCNPQSSVSSLQVESRMSPPLESATVEMGSSLLVSLSNVPLHRRAAWAIYCAASWTGLEWISSWFLTGFPWNLLATSQFKLTPLLQVASFSGVYGVSFLIVWSSISLLCAISQLFRTELSTSNSREATSFLSTNRIWAWVPDLIFPSLTITGLMIWGSLRMTSATIDVRSVQVALVQPSISQSLIFEPSESTNRFSKMLRLSTIAMAANPDILIWPEAGFPNPLRFDPTNHAALVKLLAGSDTWMILGADDVAPNLSTSDPEDYFYFNSAFLLDPKGNIIKDYPKQKLVVFGEYVPLTRWLPFLKYFTPVREGFTAGKSPSWFEMKGKNARCGMLICFEDAFPSLARKATDPNTDFLVNLTNDGWFGESSAQWQHAVTSVFRAIENGVPLVRCTNNGITCWVDAFGRIQELHSSEPLDVYKPGVRLAKIPLRLPEFKGQSTFYNEYGDVFGIGCAISMLVGVVRFKFKTV